MTKRITRSTLIILISFLLVACATPSSTLYDKDRSYLLEGKRLFQAGRYKRAMRELLPLACDGHPEAQYAIGYMYYYGYGVAQDTETGYFWISRSAQHYPKAAQALALITRPVDAKVAHG